jgi:hypothetical protein
VWIAFRLSAFLNGCDFFKTMVKKLIYFKSNRTAQRVKIHITMTGHGRKQEVLADANDKDEY